MAHLQGTQQNIESEVINYPGKVLVDFWASWCGPCQMLSPLIDEISQSFPDLKIVKVDIDSQPDLANQYQVSSIPLVIIFDHGQIKNTIIGFHQKKDYLEALK